jgi:hypothetical protein
MADKRISQLVERTDIANNDVVPIVASGASTTNKATISSIQTYMQENLDVGVTSVGITLGSSGTDVNVTGSPITTSGNITINIPTASATNRGLLSSADWSTFNGKQNSITLTTTGTSGPSTLIGSTLNIPNYTTDLSGYVTLGTAQTITAQKTFTTSGSSDTMIISHGSGSGFALDVIKAGSGEAIRVNKTSGSGNAMTIIGGNFEAPTIVKTGGTSAQFLKADGSVDSSTYLTTSGAASVYVPYTGATTSVNLGDNVLTSGGLNIDNLGGSGGALNLRQATSFSLWSGAPYTSIYATTGNNLIINFSNDNRRITLNGSIVSASTPRTFTFPDATGTLALTSDLGGYLPLAGGILTGGLFGTTAQFSGDIQSGTRLIASATSQSIILHPNNAGTTNRIEGVGTLPLALVSGSSITLAAGGTTPQITLATTGAVTLTGALNGTSASFTGNVTSTGGNFRLFNGYYLTAKRADGADINVIGFPSGSNNLTSVTAGDYNLQNTGASNLFSVSSSGAGTFSSSVTANELFIANSSILANYVGVEHRYLGTLYGFSKASANDGELRHYIGPSSGWGGKMTFYTDNTERMRITSGGTLMVNNTGSVFHSANTVLAGRLFIPFQSNADIGGVIYTYNDQTFATYEGGIKFQTFKYNGSTFNMEDSVTINGQGRVGIGTTTPSAPLDVIGGVRGRSYAVTNSIDNSVVGYVLRQGGWVGGGSTSTNLSIAAETGNGISFFVNGSSSGPPMFLNSSGNLGIGTASPTKRLDVRASVAGEVAIVSNDRNSAGDYAFVTSLGSNCNNTSAYHYIAATGGADRVYIFGNGNIQNQNNSYGGISDIKLKENIEDASPKLDDLLKVKVRNYNLIGEETKQIGVIAQELEEIFPAMIDEFEDFEDVEVPQLDEEGNEVLNEEGEVVTTNEKVSKGTTTKSVKYSVFVPMLIKAIQEQQEQINSLKNQINQL